ncbi:unnamed protein product [Ranitomeya imitator]|uniref:Receptor ligand binding region domain-containing protein n=1 Tax=Ranitomeya imitator TaxID=111125 RepID=A0ABN9MI77_9NEOB|nr:unnamed protein product [Ranitomeya imitator]
MQRNNDYSSVTWVRCSSRVNGSVIDTEPRKFSFEVLQQFQALRFAVEEINRSPSLLPNTTLGFQVYDSCAAMDHELDGTQMLLTGQERGIPNYSCHEGPSIAAIIGHSISSYSLLMAHMLGLYRYPQV